MTTPVSEDKPPLKTTSPQDDDLSTGTWLSTSSDYLRAPLVPAWTRFTQAIHYGLTAAVTGCAMTAVRRPFQTLGALSLLAIALPAAGYFSGGFRLELDIMEIFTPIGSLPLQHYDWITEEYNQTRLVLLFFHNEGANVLHVQQTRRVLEAVEVMQQTPGLAELCSKGSYVDFDNNPTCLVWSVSGYWDGHSLEAFDATVQSDMDVRKRVASNKFANGAPIFHDALLGNWEKEPLDSMDNTTQEYIMASAQSYFVRLELPDLGEEADEVEERLLNRINQLGNDWIQQDATKSLPGDDSLLQMDVKSVYAYKMETMVLILRDIYLVGVTCMVVILFTCLVFYRHDAEKAASRTLLGLASILTITMSLLAGAGIMFLAGVPWTTCNQMLPYVIYGIGLDDTFIITGAFFQIRDTKAPVERRVAQAMKQVGWSICLTTITTVVAFVLGYVSSSFPGVRWLCLYAAVIIIIVFFYQITFFVALLVLDERRIAANRRDGLCCCFQHKDKEPSKHTDDKLIQTVDTKEVASSDTSDEEGLGGSSCARSNTAIGDATPDSSSKKLVVETNDDSHSSGTAELVSAPSDLDNELMLTDSQDSDDYHKSLQERVMTWYSSFLLRPPVKIAVLIIFTAFFGWAAYSATLLEQHFTLNDYVPDDSFLKGTYENIDKYSSIVRPIEIHFRDVDQTDPQMQQQMRDYIDDLEALPQIGASNVSLSESSGEVRPFCWVRDFEEWERGFDGDPFIQAVLRNMTFLEKLDFALKDKTVREVYGQDILRDPVTGNITASRCTLFLRELDLSYIPDQVEMLMDQRAVTAAQPINNLPQSNRLAFFSWDVVFFFWQSSAVVIDEMIFTTIAGVVAVSFVSFVFVPHWTASLFVIPLICILYIELLGTVRFFGLYINPVTYICVVVSIGLLVDFLIHILLRYYEATPGKSRDGRVKETLETMGVSILVGGLSTFLAVVPLAFSSAEVFKAVFYSFFAMVSLGVSHGLILLPVLLSYCGPTVSVIGHHIASDDSGFDDDDEEEPKEAAKVAKSPRTPQTQASDAIFRISEDDDIEV